MQSVGASLPPEIVRDVDAIARTSRHMNEYEQLGCVRADPGSLALALRNLIGNAMKFSGTRPQPASKKTAAACGPSPV